MRTERHSCLRRRAAWLAVLPVVLPFLPGYSRTLCGSHYQAFEQVHPPSVTKAELYKLDDPWGFGVEHGTALSPETFGPAPWRLEISETWSHRDPLVFDALRGQRTNSARRERLCRFNTAWFSEPEGRLDLNLFQDTTLEIAVDRVTTILNADVIEARTLGGGPGSVILVHQDGSVAGRIRATNGRRYEIDTVGDGIHRVIEVDQVQRALELNCGVKCNDAGLTPAGQGGSPTGGNTGLEDASPVVMDLMVLYTTEAKEGWGGQAATEAQIVLSATYLNDVFELSRTPARVRLVHTEEITSEVFPQDVWRKGTRLLPKMLSSPWIKERKQACRADLVSLATYALEDCGGLAYCNYPNNPDIKAYSVFVRNAVTFAHEVGHNLGCRHNSTSDECIDYDYNNGYRFFADNKWYVTLMNYGYASGTRCDVFSNPEVRLHGELVGTVTNNNVRAIAKMAPLIAASCHPRFVFRNPVCSADGAQMTVEVEAQGVTPARAQVESTTDFESWAEVQELVFSQNVASMTDRVDRTGLRFYRVVAGED